MNSKKIIKLILYFLPVILIHVIITAISRNFRSQLENVSGMVNSMDDVLNIGLFFYFWVIPIYLAWVNFISHIEQDYSLYNKDIKFTYISIFLGNIYTLIFNFTNQFIGIQTGFNCFLEFIIIFSVQCVILAMTSFLGLLLIQVMDKEDDDENKEKSENEIIEKLPIEKM